jgi:hypothetical protein
MKCKHGIEQEWCSICSRRFGYELVENVYKGNPVIEILKDGEPIHRYDPHFRFGCGRARLIVSCLEVIREFAENTDDVGNTTVTPCTIYSHWIKKDIEISIEPHPDFEHSSGMVIHKPWLKLKELPLGHPHISFGVRKAHALWVLREEIEAWVRKRCK